MLQNNCTACHDTAGKLIGPSFEAINKRYAPLSGREDYLKAQIRKGSKGIWGELYQMPPHPHLQNEELKKIVAAIQALDLSQHAARHRPVTLSPSPSPRYAGTGPNELVDGIRGQATDLQHDWLGFEGDDFVATIDPVEARYLRLRARNLGTIPDWHPAKGRKAWLFVTEILVNPQN